MQIGHLFRRRQDMVRRDVNIAMPLAVGAVMFGAVVLVSWPHTGRPTRAATPSAGSAASEITVILPPSAAPVVVQSTAVPAERGAPSHPAPKPNPQKVRLAAVAPRADGVREAAMAYRRCLPGCETRDRLTRQAAVPASDVTSVSAQPAVPSTRGTLGDAIVRGGSQAFVEIVSAPAIAVDNGRQFVDGALRFMR